MFEDAFKTLRWHHRTSVPISWAIGVVSIHQALSGEALVLPVPVLGVSTEIVNIALFGVAIVFTIQVGYMTALQHVINLVKYDERALVLVRAFSWVPLNLHTNRLRSKSRLNSTRLINAYTTFLLIGPVILSFYAYIQTVLGAEVPWYLTLMVYVLSSAVILHFLYLANRIIRGVEELAKLSVGILEVHHTASPKAGETGTVAETTLALDLPHDNSLQPDETTDEA